MVHISLNKDGTVTKVINLHCVNHLKIQHTTSHQFAVDRSIDYAFWRDPHALDFPHSVKGFLIFCDHRKIRAETMIDTVARDNGMIITALIDNLDDLPITSGIDWAVACAIQERW